MAAVADSVNAGKHKLKHVNESPAIEMWPVFFWLYCQRVEFKNSADKDQAALGRYDRSSPPSRARHSTESIGIASALGPWIGRLLGPQSRTRASVNHRRVFRTAPRGNRLVDSRRERASRGPPSAHAETGARLGVPGRSQAHRGQGLTTRLSRSLGATFGGCL